ncbi:ataxia telangiectasia mutated family protein [Tanacetum coccineum]|uniref:Ataxia telangiectasia mutated family protein n=1 Tax=Tanacetum coccineum TaxID=301880 RepID=A0ABQ5HEM8_9ASTR
MVRKPTEFFLVEVGLHQGSAISAYLFVLILDEISRGIQEDIPWCLIFVDDIVLVSESTKALNIRLENWREILEDNGLRVSREKMKYLRCDFGNECWPITKAFSNKVEVAKLRMLRWICGKTLLDMIPNGVYRAQLEVETITNKMREGRLRWFGHVRRRPQSTLVRRVEALVVEGLRRRDRSKLRWEDRVKHDMNELLLSEDMTSDRNEWRAKIRLGVEIDGDEDLKAFISEYSHGGKNLVGLDLNDDSSHDVPNLGSLGCNIFQCSKANEVEVYIEPCHKRVVLSSLNYRMPVELHVDEEHAINLEVLVDVPNTLSQEGHLISF